MRSWKDRRGCTGSCGRRRQGTISRVGRDGIRAADLELLEPFGVGNPRPLLAQKELTFRAGYKMGANKSCARFQVRTPEGEDRQLVFFGNLESFGDFLDGKFGEGSGQALYAGRGDFPVSVVYQLGLNTYRGKTQLQYVMQHYC